MNKIWKKIIVLMVTAFIVVTMPVISASADSIPPEEATYSPYVVSPVNSETKNITVYGYKNTTLHVECGGTSLAKVGFAKKGFKTVSIKPQKAGKKLRFYLVTSYGKKGKAVTRTVLNLAPEKKTAALKAPKVQKNVNNLMKAIRVSAEKNTILLIKNDKAKTIAQKVFTKNGYQKITVSIPKDTKYLYFYEKMGNQRSAVTVRKIQDKIAPATPVITKTDPQGGTIKVKGELYSCVYLNYGDGWYQEGIITSKDGLTVIPGRYASDNGISYKVRLRDIAGNTSKAISMTYKGNPIVIAD